MPPPSSTIVIRARHPWTDYRKLYTKFNLLVWVSRINFIISVGSSHLARQTVYLCTVIAHLPGHGVTRTMIYSFCRIRSILWYTADAHTSGRSTWLHDGKKIWNEDAVCICFVQAPFGTILADCVFNWIESTCLLNLDRVLFIDAMRSRTVWVQYHHWFEWNRPTCMRTMAILIIYVNILNADLYRSNLRFFHSIVDFLFFILLCSSTSRLVCHRQIEKISQQFQRNRLCRILMKRSHRHALLVR